MSATCKERTEVENQPTHWKSSLAHVGVGGPSKLLLPLVTNPVLKRCENATKIGLTMQCNGGDSELQGRNLGVRSGRWLSREMGGGGN